MRTWRKGTSTNLHGGRIRPDGDRETKSAFHVDSLAPNVPKRRRGGSLERQAWEDPGRRTPEDRRVDGETVGEGRGTDQIPDGRERALKKARTVRGAGETYELTTAEKYQTINTVIRIAQIKNLVRPLCEIAGVSRSGYYAWLNRAEADEPGKVFVTDITYLPIASSENVYLSCVKDVATREIVAYNLSTNLRMNLVF